MKNNLIAPLILLFLFIGLGFSNAQDLKTLKKQIKEQQYKIQASEEALLNGVESLEKTKSRLEKNKSNNKLSPEEVTRKENIIGKIEQRLTKLDGDIKNQKTALDTLKDKYNSQKNPGTSSKVVDVKVATKAAEKTTSTDSSSDLDIDEKELEERKEKLRIAREKLEAERKERQEQLRKQEEALRIENEKLTSLDKKIKEEKAQKAKAAEDKIATDKKNRISVIEDDMIVNQEMLASGLDGLKRSKERLEKAKADGASKEAIARKEAIIKRLQERLDNFQSDIDKQKEAISKINAE